MFERRAPGPQGKELRASLRRLRRDALTTALALHARYGDVVRLAMRPHPLYLARHPDAVQHILRDQAAQYRKGQWFEAIAAVQGEGLLTSEGDLWRRQRRLAQPVFRQRHVQGFYDIIIDEAQALAQGWRQATQDGRATPVSAWLHRLAFRVVGRALLGLPPETLDPLARRLEAIAPPLMRHLISGGQRAPRLPAWLPTPRARRFRRALRGYHDIAQHMVDLRRQTMSPDPEADPDLLARLIRAHDATTGAAPKALRDDIITFIGAGVETSATALSWAFYLLAQHPEANHRLQAEIDARLAGRAPRPDNLAELHYSRMILDETLRLYPPSAVIPRQANAADDIGGYRVPTHAIVLLSPYVTHRIAAFWPDPERFDPERFAPERVRQQRRFAYFPFGAGPRACIGQSMALFEMQLTLVTLAQRYTLHLLPERPAAPALGATLQPRGGLWMTVRERG